MSGRRRALRRGSSDLCTKLVVNMSRYIVILVILIAGHAVSFQNLAQRRGSVSTLISRSSRSMLHMSSESHSAEQFHLFKKNCEGHWKGLQAGYDPQDDEVEDYMYTEVTVEGTGNGEELKQMNSFVVGEIRADCEVCFDSERVKTKEAGVFSEGSLGNRKCCANVDVRGPAPTIRGMSMEVGFRHDDGRMRILLSYSPIDFDENRVPLAMGLMDVVITRERLGKRPLKLDEAEGGWDVMWRDTSEDSFDSLAKEGQIVSSEMEQFRPHDTSLVLPSPPLVLESLAKTTAERVHHVVDGGSTVGIGGETENDDDNFVYKRVFPGGVSVEAQAIIYPGAPTEARLAYAPCPQEAMIYTADLSFAALEPPSPEQVEEEGLIRLLPPRLLDLRVSRRRTMTPF